ncbi:M20/M25/M40 family metallo-hydrolase [Caulobacter sp. S45]|uniref:M20/M25/M40 family metallo-hydrolase n=1 Tax=Caulobacter sp. S45 TaxID=1641861 RepID=UPI00131B8AE8|nr:M20/M25/M40 family metallo-hydrolase [Caulobacter sp. S45]
MKRLICSLMMGTGLLAASGASAQALRPDQTQFRALYKELVETNTTLSVGSCTEAAAKMQAHLTEAGYPAADLHPFAAPDHPKEGGLVAVLPGTDPKARPVLLLAHIDVVEAKRADWARDPFTLVEEDGYFYARGSSDDKAMAAVWVDTMARLKAQHIKLKRTVKMALTCGEETEGAFNGAGWLATHERPLVDAAFALNEGGGGQLDESGKRLLLSVEAAEKTPQNYDLTVTNPGGHSSRPVKDNAIYHLAAALMRVSQYDFPIQFNDANRAYFTAMSKIVGGEKGAAMTALMADPHDAKAAAIVTADPSWNTALRTTCVATLLNAGHATNALPQRAVANVNCRIFPGVSTDAVQQKLAEIVADPAVVITLPDHRGPLAKPTPMAPEVMGPIRTITAKYYPGVPVVPTLLAGATDGVFMGDVGIPTYGVSGFFHEPDGGHIHGLNERIGVKTLYEGRDYLFDLVKLYGQ